MGKTKNNNSQTITIEMERPKFHKLIEIDNNNFDGSTKIIYKGVELNKYLDNLEKRIEKLEGK